MQKPEKGFYRHFKGGEVEVLYIAHHSESLEEMVVYQSLYDNKTFGKGSVWVRPVSMFMETVENDGKTMERFSKITDPQIISELEKVKQEIYS